MKMAIFLSSIMMSRHDALAIWHIPGVLCLIHHRLSDSQGRYGHTVTMAGQSPGLQGEQSTSAILLRLAQSMLHCSMMTKADVWHSLDHAVSQGVK
jgi:hypothetical protein